MVPQGGSQSGFCSPPLRICLDFWVKLRWVKVQIRFPFRHVVHEDSVMGLGVVGVRFKRSQDMLG